MEEMEDDCLEDYDDYAEGDRVKISGHLNNIERLTNDSPPFFAIVYYVKTLEHFYVKDFRKKHWTVNNKEVELVSRKARKVASCVGV